MSQQTDCFDYFDCFAEFGKPVSVHRKQRGDELLKEHYPELTEMEANFIISVAVRAIEKDRIDGLWGDISRYVGLTFYHMLLAHLCTD